MRSPANPHEIADLLDWPLVSPIMLALVVGFGTAWTLASGPVAGSGRGVQPSMTATSEAVKEGYQSLIRDDGAATVELRKKWEKRLREAQLRITDAVAEVDGMPFKEDAWIREDGKGGGCTRVLAGGNVWEKAGVGLSVLYGSMPFENLKKSNTLGYKGDADRTKGYKPGDRVPFFACGLSCVMHPRNPMAPTMHFNYRYFETDSGLWWCGGGSDISPAYLIEEDVKHFHQTYKDICDKYDPEWYPRFKTWADEYFRIAHRGETRGLGGIYFDDLNDRPVEEIMEFQGECLDAILPAYLPTIQKRKDAEYTQKQKEWQQMRRGRYVEFNLVYDRGIIFGLKSGLGRVEAMMMTLPESARWEYNHQVEEGSMEYELLDACKNARDWC